LSLNWTSLTGFGFVMFEGDSRALFVLAFSFVPLAITTHDFVVGTAVGI